MQNPKVSVIIPVYNAESFIEETLESALAQTYKNIEIIVVNDGSTDGSYKKIKPYLPSIKYISQENKGVSSARNNGIRQSKGELIAFLDSDDVWVPEKLQIQVEYLNENKNTAFVHSNIKYINESSQLISPETDFVPGISGMCFRELFEGNKIATSTVVIRKDCLERVGYFTENITFAEDYELWLKMAKHFPIGYLDQPLLRYRVHLANATVCNQGNEEYYLLKVILNVLNEYSDARKILGRKLVNERLFELTYAAALNYSRQNNRSESVRHFFRAMRINAVQFFLRYPQDMIPESGKKTIRWYKHRVKEILRF